MDSTIYKFIFRHSKKEQVFILLFTVFSLPFYYVSLDIPKLIVNNVLADPESLAADAGDLRELVILGMHFGEMERLGLLALYCLLFLALVLANGGFKYAINVYKGLLGERMLRRLRYLLYSRILRFPSPHFRRVSSGELIPMVTQEVEPLGGFIGDALALPMYQGGLLVTALFFIFMQDPLMGLASIALYPMQGWIIPKLQRKVNLLGKARVQEVRKVSERISETVQGAEEMHANGMARWEAAEFTARMGRIFDIRYEIYRKKFFIKFLNNFLAQITPFFFYAIGGYFVIDGSLSLGGLVAVLAAYKDLPPPWKELLNHYQIREDAKIKYDQVVTQFAPAGMRSDDVIAGDREVARFEGSLSATGIKYTEDGDTLIDGLNLEVPLDGHVAVVGGPASGKDRIAPLIARLVDVSAGRLTYGTEEAADLPESTVGRRLGYVGPSTTLFSASLFDNLLYGLRQTPQTPRDTPDAMKSAIARRHRESELTGNSPDDVEDDWVNLSQADVEGPDGLIGAVRHALAVADLEDDVYRMGLRRQLDPEARPEEAGRLLEARRILEERLASDAFRGLVELFDRNAYNTNATVGENLLFGTPVGDAFDLDRLPENSYVMSLLAGAGLTEDFLELFDRNAYNTNATVGENLLFGTPVGDAFDLDRLPENSYVMSLLAGAGLTEDFLAIGCEVARTMVELFADLPADHEFFLQFSFISPDDLPEYRALLHKMDRSGPGILDEAERLRFLALPFKLAPVRHRLGFIDEAMQARLLEVRRAFAEGLPESLEGAISFFDRERYDPVLSLQDNILFGKVAYGMAQSQAKVGDLMAEVIEDLDLRPVVIELGLETAVGIGGARLSSAQRQKAAIARAVLKRPGVMVIAEATALLDGASQAAVMENLRTEFRGRAMIWVLHRPSDAEHFDQVLVMKDGKIAEKGSCQDLMAKASILAGLVSRE